VPGGGSRGSGDGSAGDGEAAKRKRRVLLRGKEGG
jgi:hypothetical protein